jgi:hypothetical protein
MAIAPSVAVALIAAGCGDSTSTTSRPTSTPALTKADFVSQANAICSDGNAVTDAAGSSSSPAQINDVVTNTIVPSIQGQIDAIQALAAPSGDETTVSNMLSLAQADVDKLKNDPGLIAEQSLFADFAKVAHPYGLTSCAPDS